MVALKFPTAISPSLVNVVTQGRSLFQAIERQNLSHNHYNTTHHIRRSFLQRCPVEQIGGAAQRDQGRSMSMQAWPWERPILKPDTNPNDGLSRNEPSVSSARLNVY